MSRQRRWFGLSHSGPTGGTAMESRKNTAIIWQKPQGQPARRAVVPLDK